jgi:hypothetical protein
MPDKFHSTDLGLYQAVKPQKSQGTMRCGRNIRILLMNCLGEEI